MKNVELFLYAHVAYPSETTSFGVKFLYDDNGSLKIRDSPLLLFRSTSGFPKGFDKSTYCYSSLKYLANNLTEYIRNEKLQLALYSFISFGEVSLRGINITSDNQVFLERNLNELEEMELMKHLLQ